MSLSQEWEGCKHIKTVKGKNATATMLSRAFWNGVSSCLKIFEPLVKVLRLVDGDSKPSMAFLYGELVQAKKLIMEASSNLESNYKPIISIMDAKLKDRLDSPLHLTTYLLNPYYSYRDRTIFLDATIMDGLFTCIETFYHDDVRKQTRVLNVEFDKFKRQEGAFGKNAAKSGSEDYNFNPASWWSTFGCHTPDLQRLAIRILSLTSSSSGCERNWSTFEGIHTKKRNRLDVTRLNNLVYVQFNAKLMNKQKKIKEKNIDVLLSSDATHAQGWIIECIDDDDDEVEPGTGLTWKLVDDATGANEVLQPRRSERVRDLHDEDFKSDSDEEIEEDVEFESDQEEVIPTKDYDQEDED